MPEMTMKRTNAMAARKSLIFRLMRTVDQRPYKKVIAKSAFSVIRS